MLYRGIENPSVSQLVLLPFSLNGSNSLKYALAKDDEGNLKGYCIIIESQSNLFPFIKTAKIQFGPICEKSEIEIILLSKIYSYYKDLKFAKIEIQLRHVAGQESENIFNSLSRTFSFYHKYNKNNRCTIHIQLSRTLEEIQGDFSSVLSKNIRSAINKNVKVQLSLSNEEFKEFALLYTKMGNKRGAIHYTETYLFDLCRFLITSKNGFLLCSFVDKKMIGGGLFVDQGEKTEYLIGATDPDYKKIPSSHLVLYEAIKFAKKEGKKIFDLGGIGYYAETNDQIHNINQFKETFSKNHVFYAKLMYVDMRPFYLYTLKILSFLKNRWS